MTAIIGGRKEGARMVTGSAAALFLLLRPLLFGHCRRKDVAAEAGRGAVDDAVFFSLSLSLSLSCFSSSSLPFLELRNETIV